MVRSLRSSKRIFVTRVQLMVQYCTYTTTVHTRGASSMARNRTDVSDHAAHPKGALCHLLCAEDKPHEMPDASSVAAAARVAAFDM